MPQSNQSASSLLPSRRAFFGAAALGGLALTLPRSLAAENTPYRTVLAEALTLDKGGVWTLNFAYVPIRIMKVKTPDKGTKTVWYMVYYVFNKGADAKPRDFIPEFELVTKDLNGKLGNFLDEPQPAVVDAIRKVEDPTGELKLQTTVSIAKSPIPVTNPDSVPRAVYGVAVWLDMPEQVPNATNFSVYVSGLSNGLAVLERGDEIIVRRKVLQIDFRRPTDAVRTRPDDIKINDNNGRGAEKWDYRETAIKKNKPEPKVQPEPKM